MRLKKRYLIPVALVASLALGPRASYPEINPTIEAAAIPLTTLDAHIADSEAQVANLKPNNEARIVWADSIRKTPYSVVYLHGFSAGPMEADPIHFEFAKRYGANLYLARLAQHGINDRESFGDLTTGALIDSAKEAIAIGQLIGEKVIVMSCSTGSTLSVYLAAHNPDAFDAMIMYSPNIALGSPTSTLLTMPWGLQLAKAVEGEYRKLIFDTPKASQYWTMEYRTEGIVVVKSLTDMLTTEVFKKVKHPFLVSYWYKNEVESDQVIHIPSVRNFVATASTPEAMKREVPLPDVGSHVMASSLQSKDLDSVREITFAYAEEVLGLQPVPE